MTPPPARFALPVILPDIEDHRDACVERLMQLLRTQDGIDEVHLVQPDQAGTTDEPVPPAPAICLHYDPARLPLRELHALVERAGARVTRQYGHLLRSIRAVGAEDEGAQLEAAVGTIPGVTAASVSLPGQQLRVEYDRDRIEEVALHRQLDALGLTAAPVASPDEGVSSNRPETKTSWYREHRELAWSCFAGLALLAGWLATRRGAAEPFPLACYLLAYFFGARDNVTHLIRNVRRGKAAFNIDLLMVVAAMGAGALGEWSEGALLLFLFSLGHGLEHYAMGRARNAIRALADLAPPRARVLRGNAEEMIPVELVAVGQTVRVLPAERIPVDGTVAAGRSAVDQAPITGESVPVDKGPSDPVFAGTVNGEGVLTITTTVAAGDRTLDRVVRLVTEAQTRKAPTQQFTERFARVFVPLVLVADVLLMTVPAALGLWSWSEGFYRAMALLVAASPCALALGTPAAVLAGIARAANKGVLIKGGATLEALGTLQVLAVDKTGTITKGAPVVTDVMPTTAGGDDRLLRLAAAVERQSQHPLAIAVVAEAERRTLAVPEAVDAEAVTGKGIAATVEGMSVAVGRLALFERDSDIPASLRETMARLEADGRTTMAVRATSPAGLHQWLGALGIADEIRPEAAAMLRAIHGAGIRRIVMLTGDNAQVGESVGRAVGIDEVRAGLMPDDKATIIEELALHGPVAMVGDGVNDAPALATATVGIAMGGAGTAAALETADLALMGDDLSALPFGIGLSRATRRVIRQNLFLSLSVIAILVVATIGGWAGIGFAVIVHEGSTLVVIANSLRMLGYRRVAPAPPGGSAASH